MSKARRTERGIHALYAEDPQRADRLLWGRESDPVSRRGFLRKSALLAMGSALGASIPFAKFMPSGLIPAALADRTDPFKIPGKDPDLIVLNDRPINAETPPHLLDDAVTPADKLFVRNNGIPPSKVDPEHWRLVIDGESARQSVEFSIADLKRKFQHHTYQLVIECAGNGRSEFNPPVGGNQWTTGAIGCPEWTGVRLRDVLEAAGIEDDAVYIGYYGKDHHLSGDPSKNSISRGVPMSKALEDETLVAWAMNGEDIPALHGHPLRLVCGGWPASTSGKWLSKIVIRNKIHDGAKMGGKSYRVPCHPVEPDAKVADEDMCIIESMPVKSLITYPRTGAMLKQGQSLPVRGHAWAGDLKVEKVEISIDFGVHWRPCNLEAPKNRLAWQHWQTRVDFPGPGYYEVWARATDSEGNAQPMVVPGWNPKGYLNNACHRIAVKVL
ncbi:MAG: sulfite oxidase [Methylohalobius sp. ZOD2]|nr:sulfite oxidase [Methylothermaceae bacterium]